MTYRYIDIPCDFCHNCSKCSATGSDYCSCIMYKFYFLHKQPADQIYGKRAFEKDFVPANYSWSILGLGRVYVTRTSKCCHFVCRMVDGRGTGSFCRHTWSNLLGNTSNYHQYEQRSVRRIIWSFTSCKLTNRQNSGRVR